MAEKPLYPKVVVGFVDDERGEDARVIGERIVERDGGELNVVHVDKGSPAKVLRDLAEKGEADLIVLGSTHRAAIGSVAPGSVAEQLLKGAPAALVIAPRGYARAVAITEAEASGETADDVPEDFPLRFIRDQLRVIAVGFDGSSESRAALDEAAVLAERFKAAIRIVAVSEPLPQATGPATSMPGGAGLGFDLQSRLHDAAAEMPSELRVQPILDKGEPVEKLQERAGEGVDLLVLGSRGFGPVMRLMLGSVSARVIRDAPCAVMIVPRST